MSYSTYKWYHMISVFLLSSLGVIISSCIHVAANGIIFLFYDWVKLNIQKTKIMTSGPITSWEIDGETVETLADFIFGGSKITEDGDCSHGIKRCLLLGSKVMTNVDSIFKSRDITLPTKVHLVKAMFFSNGHVWM